MLVWLVWASMAALFFWLWLPVSSPVPLAEDWYTVPLLTGQPVDLLPWLWEQNNEHRMPIARLLLLGVLKLADGDYRAGGLLNMTLLAGGAAALILFARHLRGGITDPADAFFPLTLLNFGHSVDALFPFQITFVLSLTLIMLAGCPLFLPRSISSRSAAGLAGAALLLLPLSGFIGLLFVPGLAVFFAYAGACCWSGRRGWPRTRAVAAWLLVASAGAVVLAAAYFVGYEHPPWNPPNPGLIPSAKVILKMFALGFGPTAQFWWAPAVVAGVLFLAACAWHALLQLRRPPPAREQAAGRAIFFATAVTFAAGVGWGRAAFVPEFGLPLRYVSIALPAFIAGYLIWVAPAARLTPVVQRGLALVMLVLLPFNTVAGHRLFADWYAEGMTSLQADIQNGVPLHDLAIRHSTFLVHWWTPEKLEQHMKMLQDAGIAPFDRVAMDPRSR